MRLPRSLTRALSLVATVGLVAGGGLVAASSSSAVAGSGAPLPGNDVSWPQCPPEAGGNPAGYGLPGPREDARFVVIGTTNGFGFSVNPCLAEQVAAARERDLLTAAYALTTFPTPPQLEEYADDGPFDASTRDGQLRNVGWSQAQFTVAQMRAVGLDVPFLWFDVEPVNPERRPPWSDSGRDNAQVVLGALRGYQAEGFDVGFYSTPALWQQVVGAGLPELRGHFEWRTAGRRGRDVALTRCGDDATNSFQGGPAVLAQWYDNTRDDDVTCPGFSGPESLERFFLDWTDSAEPEPVGLTKTRRVLYAPAG